MPKTKTEINLRLFDETALIDSTYSAVDIQPFANLDDLKIPFDPPVNYATLENDQWILDGTMDLFPVNMESMKFGYWSQTQADANKMLNVVFDIDFESTHSTIGITILFYEDEYSSLINIEWYDINDDLITSKDFVNDKRVFFADQSVDDYKRIKITFKEMNKAGHYVKVSEIGFGADILFTDEDIQSCKIIEELNPISDELSINKMNSNIFIQDSEYISRIYKVLQDQQKLIVYEYVNDVKKEMGSFYLTTRNNPNENTIKFESEDIIGSLASRTYMGGAINDTFENVIDAIMIEYGTDLYDISDDLKSLNVTGYIPITDYRRAIQIVAFAVNAVVDCSRTDKIKFYKLSTNNPQTVDKNRFFIGSSQIELPRVTGVSLLLKSYSIDAAISQIYNVVHSAGTYVATFSEPFANLLIQNGTIIESSVNHVKFSTTGGNVIITGNPYNVSNQTFLIETPNLPLSINKNVVEFENTVIWDGQQNVQNLYDRLTKLTERNVRMVLESESVGNFVEISALYDKVIDGYVESVEIDLTGGFVGQFKIGGVIK